MASTVPDPSGNQRSVSCVPPMRPPPMWPRSWS